MPGLRRLRGHVTVPRDLVMGLNSADLLPRLEGRHLVAGHRTWARGADGAKEKP